MLEQLTLTVEQPHIKDAREYLSERNLKPFSTQELNLIGASFSEALTQGSETKGVNGLPMVNSLVDSVNLENLPVGAEAMVLVIGGTYLRGYAVEVTSSHKLRIKGDPETRSQYRVDLKYDETKEFKTPEEFSQAMLEKLSPFIENYHPQAVITLFTFGATPTNVNGKLDVIPFATMGKGFAVEGIANQPFGEVFYKNPLLAHLKDIPKIVINDVPALGSIKEARICCFNSSGFNIGVMINGRWYITECGGAYEGLPKNNYSILVDERSNNPRRALLEKQLTAPYMLQQFKFALEDLQTAGLVSLPEKFDITPENFSALANGTDDLLSQVNPKSAEIIKMTAQIIGLRSAQVMGTLLGTTIKTYSQEFPDQNIFIPVQSKVVYAMKDYEEIATAIASQLSGKNVSFSNIPDGDILGAAAIGLSI